MRNAVVMSVMLICALAARGAFVPPESAIVADRVAEAVANDIASGRMPDAVQRLQALLTDENAKYVQDGERLLSVRLWVESLMGAKREAFVAQYEKTLGAAATTEISAAARDGSVDGMMRAASRYPWTVAARKAPEAAAQVALKRGDISSAQALLARLGAEVSDPQLRKIGELPADSVLPTAAFSAGWYRSYFPGLEPRSVPVASKELCVVATPRAVVALAADGKVIWTTGQPQPIRLQGESRGKQKSVPVPDDRSLSRAVVWCDVSGKPRLVVARVVESAGAFLRAYDVTDGRVIWSTSDHDSTRELVMAGAPAAAGGYVYFNAVKFDPASGLHSVIGALDVVTGKLAWSAGVGEMHERVTNQQKRGENETHGVARGIIQSADASAQLSLDPHHVYAVLGPWVVAVDRFSGTPTWFAKYPNRPLDEKQIERDRRSTSPPLQRRWRDMAVSDGKTVVVAPIDSDLVLGLDAGTGATKWKEDGLRGDELVGESNGRVLFVGASLAAVEMGTGELAWQNALPDADFVGPAFVDGEHLGVMTERGAAYFDVARGLVVRRRGEVPSFDALLRQPQVRQALLQAEAIDYFDPRTR